MERIVLVRRYDVKAMDEFVGIDEKKRVADVIVTYNDMSSGLEVDKLINPTPETWDKYDGSPTLARLRFGLAGGKKETIYFTSNDEVEEFFDKWLSGATLIPVTSAEMIIFKTDPEDFKSWMKKADKQLTAEQMLRSILE